MSLAPVSRLWSLVLGLALCAGIAMAGEVTVFAAASLKTVLDDVSEDFTANTGQGVAISFAASSALARQIQLGAPADIFISANPDWMDVLEEDGLIREGSRVALTGNRLVLIAHGADAEQEEIGPGFDLARRLGDGWLAMALVDAVPAGIYGKAALEALGQWSILTPKIAQVDNARAALALVAIGEAPMGIVYASDAMAEPRVSVIGIFPSALHPPIVYPAALMEGEREPQAAAFLEYLQSPAVRAAFERHGFADVHG